MLSYKVLMLDICPDNIRYSVNRLQDAQGTPHHKVDLFGTGCYVISTSALDGFLSAPCVKGTKASIAAILALT